MFDIVKTMPIRSIFITDAQNITTALAPNETNNVGMVKITKVSEIRVLVEYYRMTSGALHWINYISLDLNNQVIEKVYRVSLTEITT